MVEIFVRLLVAHLITDFVLQPSDWVEDKQLHKWKSPALYKHIGLTGIVAYISLWDLSLWYVALIVMVTHYAIDLVKLCVLKEGLMSFVIDQALHMIVLAGCAVSLAPSDFLSITFDLNLVPIEYWYYVCAYLFVTAPLGHFIGQATATWRQEMPEGRDSLQRAGIWIGIIERLLVLTFVILEEYQAIGFLIAAKSILRFSDKDGANAGKQTEYVLIGTLMSFGLALAVGLVLQYLVK